MPKTADEQTVADDMYRYFNREWDSKIQAALRQRSDTAQNTIANLLTDAYLCGVRDGDGFGMETLAHEAARANAGAPSALLPGLDHMRGDGRNMELLTSEEHAERHGDPS